MIKINIYLINHNDFTAKEAVTNINTYRQRHKKIPNFQQLP
jgi:hypothetical protein